MNASPSTQAFKKISVFVAGTSAISLVLWLPSKAVAAALPRKESLWSLEPPVPERSRVKWNNKLEMTCFPFSEKYQDTGGMHEQCYSAKSSYLNTTSNRNRTLSWKLCSLEPCYTTDAYARTQRLASNFKAQPKNRTLNLDKLNLYYCWGTFFLKKSCISFHHIWWHAMLWLILPRRTAGVR